MEVSWVDSWLTGFKPAATYKSRHQWLSSACEPLLVTFFDYSLEHAMNMEYLAQQADEVGLKLEWTAGIPTWEPLGLAWHQKAVYRIQSTIKPVPPTEASKEDQRGCFHVADVYIRFPDGSLKRPDIAIFCEEPPDTDDALTIVPAAVIEILSKGYEQKDTTIGAPFYVAQGIQDVLLYDPRSAAIAWFHNDVKEQLQAPKTLACGCEVSF